jgi:hypothetical protein
MMCTESVRRLVNGLHLSGSVAIVLAFTLCFDEGKTAAHQANYVQCESHSSVINIDSLLSTYLINRISQT